MEHFSKGHGIKKQSSVDDDEEWNSAAKSIPPQPL